MHALQEFSFKSIALSTVLQMFGKFRKIQDANAKVTEFYAIGFAENEIQ